MKNSLVNFCVFYQMIIFGFRIIGSVINFNVQFMTFILLVCIIFDFLLVVIGVVVFVVSLFVSNNGQVVSQFKFFIVYYFMCYSCDSVGQCISLVSFYKYQRNTCIFMIYKYVYICVIVINICMEYYMYGEMKCLFFVVEMYELYMNVYLYICRIFRKK